ncbi:MAG TPA: hypothetical protein VFZ91_03935 [Allosphingosinicella sp.]
MLETGIDFARAARKLQPQLPVLIKSGYAQVEGIAGDLPRLTKPFRRDEVEGSISQLSGAAEESPEPRGSGPASARAA